MPSQLALIRESELAVKGMSVVRHDERNPSTVKNLPSSTRLSVERLSYLPGTGRASLLDPISLHIF